MGKESYGQLEEDNDEDNDIEYIAMIKATKKLAIAGVGIRGREGKPKQRYSTEALMAKEKAIGKIGNG